MTKTGATRWRPQSSPLDPEDIQYISGTPTCWLALIGHMQGIRASSYEYLNPLQLPSSFLPLSFSFPSPFLNQSHTIPLPWAICLLSWLQSAACNYIPLFLTCTIFCRPLFPATMSDKTVYLITGANRGKQPSSNPLLLPAP